MTITNQWLDEYQNIILVHVEGEWTWEEYEISGRILQQMAQSVGHRCGMIINWQTTFMPPIGVAQRVKDSCQFHHELGFDVVAVVMQPSAFVEMFKNALALYAHSDCCYVFCLFVDEAYQLIQAYRQSANYVSNSYT